MRVITDAREISEFKAQFEDPELFENGPTTFDLLGAAMYGTFGSPICKLVMIFLADKSGPPCWHELKSWDEIVWFTCADKEEILEALKHLEARQRIEIVRIEKSLWLKTLDVKRAGR